MANIKYNTALIVGAGSGLSASLARAFSKEGIKVALAARSTGDLDALVKATGAKAFACDAYVSTAHRSIQIFGAIGFTWEMVNHLYFKRARANAELFGSARAQRARVIGMVEKKAA